MGRRARPDRPPPGPVPMSQTPSPSTRERPIRVKFLCRMDAAVWLRQFPHGEPVWGPCQFLLDPDARDYDWVVVYNDLPSRRGERFSLGAEVLDCPPAHTVLVTTEPSSIKAYGSAYTRQFGCVLTSQEPWALPHRDRIYCQPALHWIYGLGGGRIVPYDALASAKPPDKPRLIATVCSSKRQRHTLHRQRFRFTAAVQAAMPELEVFGHGVREIADKAEALDPYRYHIAVENHISPHHWTEKLADAFLGFTLPFYAGCPNAADYFPPESFIPVDIHDPEGAVEIIRRAIRDGEYEKRLPHVLEARRRVLETHNLFAVLAREIARRHRDRPRPEPPGVLRSRRALRRGHPLVGMGQAYEKYRARVLTALKRRG